MPKRKCNFTDEMRKKYPCFRLGRDKWEAECTVCKAGTYVSVANKGSNDLQAHIDTTKHKTAVRGETSSAKLTEYFVRPGKAEDMVNAAEGVLAFHTVKHHKIFLMVFDFFLIKCFLNQDFSFILRKLKAKISVN